MYFDYQDADWLLLDNLFILFIYLGANESNSSKKRTQGLALWALERKKIKFNCYQQNDYPKIRWEDEKRAITLFQITWQSCPWQPVHLLQCIYWEALVPNKIIKNQTLIFILKYLIHYCYTIKRKVFYSCRKFMYCKLKFLTSLPRVSMNNHPNSY